ncbi:Spore maturation protein A [bioreactor metagenome]|uniref:Spore maturation protein A n=1 Tax=bioreactor metagenome TaxID=1076179 RepID=A0A645HNU0_9ZZZZ
MMVVFSFFCAVAKGNMGLLSQGILDGGQSAVELCIKLTGMLCLWSGIMNIAEKAGLTQKISKVLSPFYKLVFKNTSNASAMHAVSMNITANILGLGNAATPLGLEAMRRMQEDNKSPLSATDDMVSFVVMNSAALRIIPTTVATLRASYGSANPMGTILATWAASFLSLFVGLLLARVLRRAVK